MFCLLQKVRMAFGSMLCFLWFLVCGLCSGWLNISEIFLKGKNTHTKKGKEVYHHITEAVLLKEGICFYNGKFFLVRMLTPTEERGKNENNRFVSPGRVSISLRKKRPHFTLWPPVQRSNYKGKSRHLLIHTSLQNQLLSESGK